MEYTVDQPNETNSTLKDAIAYWETRAYRFTMLWGRECIQNPFSQISPKFAALANTYYAHKLLAESELKRLIALKPYTSPLMYYVVLNILINALLCNSSYTIRHDNRVPVTVVLPNRATNRVVRYCVVKAYKRNPLMGKITINGQSRKVSRTLQINGQYSQWSLL